MLRYLLVSILCFAPTLVLADDVPPPVQPEVSSIQAVSKVEGTGKKDAPYQFDATTICVLSLPSTVTEESLKDIKWDFELSPEGIIPIQNNRLIVFPINKSGVFKAAAYGKDAGYWTVWFEIKGANSPPPLVGSKIKERTKKLLVGPNAKTDAVILVGTCQSTLAMINEFKDSGELQQTFVRNLNVSGWHTGSYPDFGVMLNENIPPGDAEVLDDTSRQRLIKFFSDVEAGAKEIVK